MKSIIREKNKRAGRGSFDDSENLEGQKPSSFKRLRVTLDTSTELEDQGEVGCSDTVCYNADGTYLGKVTATVVCRSQRFSATNKSTGKSEYDVDLDFEYGAFS